MVVLITGCQGLLGQKLLQYQPNWAYTIGVDLHGPGTGFYRPDAYQCLDITDREATRRLVESGNVDWIINTAAFTNVDACERDREACWRVNVEAVGFLAAAAKGIGARLLQLSTDYVFDGSSGPYGEEDEPAPLGVYGRSKLASERVLQDDGVEFLIVRTNVLYGHVPGVRPNFVHWVLDKLGSGAPFQVVSDQVGNPTLADDLAVAIWTLVAAEARGVYHLGGPDFVDRRTFAQAVAEVFGFSAEAIGAICTSELGQLAPRPLQSGLRWDKARKRFSIEMRGIRDGLTLMREHLGYDPLGTRRRTDANGARAGSRIGC